MIILLFTLFVISIVLLIPAVLLQSTSETGIFSSNITAGAFGARSNEILVKFTAWCTAIFILSALAMSYYFVQSSRPVNLPEPAAQQAPAAPIDAPTE
ncbi:MAG: preprotein translocase subunit SecG [Brevinema sp.]